jgi:hypothetical protein
VLSAAEYDLFCHFFASDQQHSINVMRLLRDSGQTQPDLLKAALLHDIGKTRADLHVWDRSLVVLGNRFMPKRAEAWGALTTGDSAELNSWRKGFIVKVRHPAWGAKMAAAAGSSPLTVSLIRHHQDPVTHIVTEEDHLLKLLQSADDQS